MRLRSLRTPNSPGPPLTIAGAGELRTCRCGFTLVELILVSVVLAILTAVAIPGFSNTSRRLRAEQTAFHVAQLLRYARGVAVTEQATIACAWDAQLRRAYLERWTEGAWVRVSGSHASSAAVPSEITITLLLENSPADRVRFFPDGTSERATWLVSHRGHLYTVAVNATTGQTRLTTDAQTL